MNGEKRRKPPKRGRKVKWKKNVKTKATDGTKKEPQKKKENNDLTPTLHTLIWSVHTQIAFDLEFSILRDAFYFLQHM
jgi:hypothetical protein